MRYSKRKFANAVILIMVLVFCISLTNPAEACIELKTSKAIYFPGETAQLEIDADVTRTISSSDIFLYRGATRLPIAIFFSKVADKKYFAWFDLPKQPGTYTIKARGYCPDLKLIELPVEIKDTIAVQHSNFKAKIENKWKTLPLETHILAAGVVSYDELAYQAFSEYVRRIDSCINLECSTKEAALTLTAFENILLRKDMTKMLDVYQNYFNQGQWQIQISSNTLQKCNITIKNTTTVNTINGNTSINLTDFLISQIRPFDKTINIELKCGDNVDALLNYKYKNFEKNFELKKEGVDNKLGIAINNLGCWGTGLKTTCDSSATSYVLLSLKKINAFDFSNPAHLSAYTWLQENAESIEEKAVLYYLIKTENEKTNQINNTVNGSNETKPGINADNNELLPLILAMQNPSGFWLNKENEPSVKTTALILFILKNSDKTEHTLNAITNAEVWLKSKNLILSEESFVLFFAFPSNEIEPVLSIWPGLIKTASRDSFNLVLTNKGATDIKLNAVLFDLNTEITLEKNSMKNMHFNMPPAVTLDGRPILSNLAIDYNSAISDKHYFYTIPLLIFTEKGDKEYIGKPNATEQKINQTEQQKILNETNPLENETTGLNISLIEKNFRFFEKNLTLKINNTDAEFTEEITLGNALDKKVTDIEISPSIALQQLSFVTVNPMSIQEIAPGEKVKIKLNINPSAVPPKTYEGYIQITAKYGLTGITTNIPVTITVAASGYKLLNCSELGGISCNPETMECKNTTEPALDTDYCCVPKEACKKKTPAGRNIGLAIVAIVIVILLVLLLILRKKPKKEMKTFLEEKARELEKQRIKRPPSLTKKPPGLFGLSKKRQFI